MARVTVIAVPILGAVLACAPAPAPPPSSGTTALPGAPSPARAPGPGSTQKEAASIGSASMEPDGTIVLDLRAVGAGGTLGDGRLVYPPTHPDYRSILEHLGGLQPGQTKPVPPWPDSPQTTGSKDPERP